MNAKQFFKALPFGVLALMMGACDNNEFLNNVAETEGAGQLVPMTFTAGFGMVQTRTEMTNNIVNGVNWQAGDAISVLSLSNEGNSLGDYQFTTQDAGATATFTGQAQDAAAFFAVYPYREGLSGSVGDIEAQYPKRNLSGLSLSADQQAVPGSFDPEQHIAVAYKSSSDMSTGFSFKNLCTLVKFSIGGSEANDVKKVTLTATGDETLAADAFSVECQEGYTSMSYSSTYIVDKGGTSSVSLTVKDGFFLPRTDYYFVIFPGNGKLSGMRLTFEKADGSSVTKSSTTETTIAANRILNLGEFLLGDYEVLENTELIEAINNSGTKVNWTVNEDGTVTLNEDNWAAMQRSTILSLNNKGLTDLSGIEYFTKLTSLDCSGNADLTKLNVSSLTDLTDLNCSNCQLTSLDVSKQTKLTYLNCNYNQLVSLDVNTLTDLTMLYCYGNELTTLNVDNLTKLEFLGCRENRLEALSIVNNTALNQDKEYPGLLCGNQKDNITLTLTLTSDQEQLWNDFWENPFTNNHVELNVVTE